MAFLTPTQPYPASTNGGLGWVTRCPAAANSGIPCPAIASGGSKLHAIVNGGTHAQKRPLLKFLLKETLLRKMFLKEAPLCKFAEAWFVVEVLVVR